VTNAGHNNGLHTNKEKYNARTTASKH